MHGDQSGEFVRGYWGLKGLALKPCDYLTTKLTQLK